MMLALSWILAYLALVSFPLIVLLLGAVPPGGGLWWDFAMGIGFAGLAIMGVQFALTARFRRATAPFGMDIIYYFHRWMAVAGIGLLLAHHAILQISFSEAVGPVNPGTASWHMTAGRVAILFFGVIVVTSIWRKQLRIEYDRWRIWHGLLAVSAVLLAVAHIEGAGYYTSTPWKRALWGGYSILWLLLIGYIRVVKPWWIRRKPYRVIEISRERGRAWTLTLEPDGHPGMSFKPGQFAWLTLGRSPFRFKEHPFSFSGSAAEARRLRFTIKELGDFTRTISQVRKGEKAYLDGPHGVFTVDRYRRAPGFVFVSGGVGIAPNMSMLRTLADRGDRRPLRLIYCNNRWEDVLFREELEHLRARLDLEVVHVLRDPPEEWRGEQGILTESILRRVLPREPVNLEYFLCGPKAMSETVERALRNLGVPLRRIHFELFDMA